MCAAASGLPPLFAAWFAALVGRDRWHCFLARDAGDGAAVATGAIYAGEDVAYLGFAATCIERRGRGAQGALLSARIRRAHELALSTVVASTAEPLDGLPGPSYRNLQRSGFRPVAYRPPGGWLADSRTAVVNPPKSRQGSPELLTHLF